MPPVPPVDQGKPINNLDESHDGDEADVDEEDPLWKATMKICNDNKEEALKMLENPDALMSHPEVIKYLEKSQSGGDSTGDGADDWENAAEEESLLATGNAAEGAKQSTAIESDKKESDTKPEDDDIEAEDEDERPHLNLVFIGHVDAGKSTLSGSILYTMGMVDTRTIEKFEREAKQRNRESWFLAFIMDTSEEERAKGKTVEVGRAHFDTEVNRYTILDALGIKITCQI